jgi:hypothetical protein
MRKKLGVLQRKGLDKSSADYLNFLRYAIEYETNYADPTAYELTHLHEMQEEYNDLLKEFHPDSVEEAKLSIVDQKVQEIAKQNAPQIKIKFAKASGRPKGSKNKR